MWDEPLSEVMMMAAGCFLVLDEEFKALSRDGICLSLRM